MCPESRPASTARGVRHEVRHFGSKGRPHAPSPRSREKVAVGQVGVGRDDWPRRRRGTEDDAGRGRDGAAQREGSLQHQADKPRPAGRPRFAARRRWASLRACRAGTCCSTIRAPGARAVVFAAGAGLTASTTLKIHIRSRSSRRRCSTTVREPAGATRSSCLAAPPRLPMNYGILSARRRRAGSLLLVGHSLGGLLRTPLCTALSGRSGWPALFRPAHEDYLAHTPKQTLLGTLQTGLCSRASVPCDSEQFYRDMFERMFAEWPVSIRDRLAEYHLGSLRKSLQEWPAR